MNPLHADALTLHRESYNEPKIVIWEEGEFKEPIVLLSAVEATNLRYELDAALKRLPKAP